MSHLKPPFTLQTAQQKVKAAQALWNTQYRPNPHLHPKFSILISNRTPSLILPAYSTTCIWRNRSTFLRGHPAISSFLVSKWTREKSYRLRKELFAFHENKIAVQFWYEFQDAADSMKWKRCYGLEDWTYNEEGRMVKRMMSGNDVEIGEGGRWFTENVKDVDEVEIGEEHW